MKKYIKPMTKTVQLENTELLANSFEETDKFNDTGGAAKRGFRTYFEEYEEYE